MRERLRGRRLHDLRRWTELHTGSTQAALLEIHVRHALRFVHELNATHSVVEAIQVYEEMVGVPDIMTSALRIYVFDRLAAEELPKGTIIDVNADPAQVPLFPAGRRPKRVS
jgi:hypothetical protein